MVEKLRPIQEVAAHLREEADFNRSWIDGRRLLFRQLTEGYFKRRIEVAEQRDRWVAAIEAQSATLRRCRDMIVGLQDDAELMAQHLMGITPDENTQTESEVQATRDAIEGAAYRACEPAEKQFVTDLLAEIKEAIGDDR